MKEQKDLPTIRKNIVGSLDKLIWLLGAASFWYWLIALHGKQLAFPQLQYVGYLALLPLVRLSLRRQWWKGIIQSVLLVPLYYFLLFPIIIITRLFLVLRGVPLKFIKFTSSTKTFLFTGLGCWIIIIIILKLSNPIALYVFSTLNLLCINLLSVCGLIWANNPLKPLAEASVSFWRFGERLIDKLVTSPKEATHLARIIRDWLKKRVVNEHGELRNIETLREWFSIGFVGVVITLFLTIVSGYAAIYLGLHRAGWQVLHGLGEKPSFGLTWYYSLTITVTALFDDVIPLSSVGRVVQSLQLFNAAVFLTLIICLFSYATSTRILNDFESLKRYPKRLIEKLDQMVKHDMGENSTSETQAC